MRAPKGMLAALIAKLDADPGVSSWEVRARDLSVNIKFVDGTVATLTRREAERAFGPWGEIPKEGG